jgi:hypothetical protein
LPYIAGREEKPFIAFEYNYKGAPLTMTEDEAKAVHDSYVELGYTSYLGFPAKGDGYFAVK